MIKYIIADHFSGNPQTGCRVTYPISRLYSNLDAALAELPGVRRGTGVPAILNERGLLLKMVYHYDRAL